MWDSEPEQQGHHAEGNAEREEENERHAPMQKIAALDSGAPAQGGHHAWHHQRDCRSIMI
eukprot:3941815-Rhodomonas_salina.1